MLGGGLIAGHGQRQQAHRLLLPLAADLDSDRQLGTGGERQLPRRFTFIQSSRRRRETEQRPPDDVVEPMVAEE